MAQQTQKYNRSLSGSVGAGMKSLVGGNGRRFYVLEHKVSSKYHKAGENQRIIVDQIELGRDPRCQVRFDESFDTVSRRHAAIVREDDNWKLIPLSQTNTTYLNGRPLTGPWYLQNGDEIQLSTNGPKMGFITPEGDRGLVKSIGLTARMNLFRQQALRPYKRAIAAIAAVFVCALVVGAVVISKQSTRIEEQGIHIAEQDVHIASQDSVIQLQASQISDLLASQDELSGKLTEQIKNNEQLRRQIQRIGNRVSQAPSASTSPAPQHFQSVSKDVYWINVDKVTAMINGEEHTLDGVGWIATGFLLDDGKFVTARHCVDGWRYPQGEAEEIIRMAQISEAQDNGIPIKAYLTAYSNDGTVLSFTSDQFHTDRGRTDTPERIQWQDDSGEVHQINFKRGNFDGTDFAWVQTSHKGGIKADANLSNNLQATEKVYVLGYPHGFGAGRDVSDQRSMNPVYSESVVARAGLTENGRIHLSNRNFEGGNSGGPVFVMKDGQLTAVAIVSHGMESIGFVTPISTVLR